MVSGAALVFALVMVLLALSFLRRSDGAQKESVWILGGLVFTSTVLVGLLAWGLFLGERLLPKQAPHVLTVEAEAMQWQWIFRQLAANGGAIERVGILDIPAAMPVDVRITSRDVIHSFWVPRLGGKLDAIPGKINVLRIEAAEPGTYEAICAEYCGLGHARMRFRVIAHDSAGWAALQEGSPR